MDVLSAAGALHEMRTSSDMPRSIPSRGAVVCSDVKCALPLSPELICEAAICKGNTQSTQGD